MVDKAFVEGWVRDVAKSGDGLVETEKGVVFVRGVLPTEKLLLKPLKRKGGREHGRLVKLLQASKGRVDPACEASDRCGGCPWMIADADLQRQLKQTLLNNAIGRIPGLRASQIGWVDSPKALAYRNRARLHWQGGVFGYQGARTTSVKDIDRCIVLRPELQAAWTSVIQHLQPILRGGGQIQLTSGAEGLVTVVLHSENEQPSQVFDACEALSSNPPICSVSLYCPGANKPGVWGNPVEIAAFDGGRPLRIPAEGFIQANPEINAALVRHVYSHAKPEGRRVLELFCGSGNLTVALAEAAASLVAVETDPKAAASCQHNLKARDLSARVVVERAENYPKGKCEVVVLDPPRIGASNAVKRIANEKIKSVVYVSCNVATLARDLRTLIDSGYEITHATAFDMFPQTAHVEIVVALEYRP